MITTRKNRIFLNVITYIILILFATFCVFPLLWMLGTAIKPTDEVRLAIPTFFTTNPTLENFVRVIVDNKLLIIIKNSFIVSSIATIASLIISVFAAYTMSRYSYYKGIKLSALGMIISQMVPPVLLLTPLYLIMLKTNILDTYLSLILAYITFVIPLCTFILKGFFDTLSYSLEEAAEIDGCSRIGIIFRVILPVSVPSLIATGLYAFVQAWNEFMFGYVFINSDAKRTITPAIKMFQGSNITDWGGMMAASSLAVIPVAIIFLVFQRYFIAGMTSGSVKE